MMGEPHYLIDGKRFTRREFDESLKNPPRPKIGLNERDQVTHNGIECRVVMRRNLISVACADITPAALQHILDRHKAHFGVADEVVLQDPKQDTKPAYLP